MVDFVGKYANPLDPHTSLWDEKWHEMSYVEGSDLKGWSWGDTFFDWSNEYVRSSGRFSCGTKVRSHHVTPPSQPKKGHQKAARLVVCQFLISFCIFFPGWSGYHLFSCILWRHFHRLLVLSLKKGGPSRGHGEASEYLGGRFFAGCNLLWASLPTDSSYPSTLPKLGFWEGGWGGFGVVLLNKLC